MEIVNARNGSVPLNLPQDFHQKVRQAFIGHPLVGMLHSLNGKNQFLHEFVKIIVACLAVLKKDNERVMDIDSMKGNAGQESVLVFL